jgi:GDP-L-fucose synthase
MHRFYEAKKKKFQEVIIWGSGNAKREFLYVDDMTRACYLLMNLDKKIYDKYTSPMLSHINIGSGNEISIKKLANLMKKIVNYKGKIIFDKNKPDGTLRKKVDTTILNEIGFKAKVKLETGLIRTYKDHQKFRENN